ncbi:hypothetical protein C922_00847 [Plasmodium inui San Antonio 1]|uniref:Transmembrane protein n=1 Tax=Plasmodium inui San Antonio 1 TaxID=1237626 RepID=W7ASK5_9APIC|nr:hypothetical protein C922_00847 [Plasmodium inui San Antonio 1]EUD68451.1 hypothetical protein C922_00847 [Plasmodium inui San Antonio 1]
MRKVINWCAFIILAALSGAYYMFLTSSYCLHPTGTSVPLGLSALSLWYLNVDKEKNQVHSYNNEYRRKQRELLKSQQGERS